MLLLREIVGWGLLIFSLLLVKIGLSYITDMQTPRVVEAGVVMFTAMAVLRAAILLIRISMAARVVALERETDRKS